MTPWWPPAAQPLSLIHISLAQFESKLGEFGFFRVHRRYIVNLANVEDVETVPSGAIQLGVNGVDERIPVSRRRVVPLKKALNL